MKNIEDLFTLIFVYVIVLASFVYACVGGVNGARIYSECLGEKS